MEAYAGRASMEARARRRVEKGRKTDLFKLMEEHGRTRLTSSIWAHALERDDKVATELIDEAVEALGAGVGSAINLLDVEAVIIGGGLGVALRRADAPSASPRRCNRTCSTTRTRPMSRSRRSVTSAERSARRCSSARPRRCSPARVTRHLS